MYMLMTRSSCPILTNSFEATGADPESCLHCVRDEPIDYT